MWPQWTMLFLLVLGLGIGLEQHGKERSPGNFWTALIATAISAALLYYGGFFKGMF